MISAMTRDTGHLDQVNGHARLRSIIADRSFIHGREVTLSSGKKSEFYFDMKPTMMHPEASVLISKEILSRLPDNTELVGGLVMGAVPIAGALCATSFLLGKPLPTFFIRKEAKEHGAKKRIEGIADRESVRGKKVVVVDDVTTSGNSALQAVEILQQEGAIVAKVIAIVDRDEEARELFEGRGIDFEALFSARDFL